MPYAVVLHLDPHRDQPIRSIYKELAEKDIAPAMYKVGINPHVTLAIYNGLRCQSCEKKLRTFANRNHVLELNFSHIGVFNTHEAVVFIAPTVTNQLLRLHAEVHDILQKDGLNPWELYLPEKWVPHSTLALETPPSKIPQAVEIVQQLNLPLKIKVISIGVIEFLPIISLFEFGLVKD